MAAGDGHSTPRVGQRAEQPRPLHQRTTRGESGGDLGVVRAHRRRRDDEVGFSGGVGRTVPDRDRDALAFQLFEQGDAAASDPETV